MVKLLRCEICGDGYIGDSSPHHCPFCGAHGFLRNVEEVNPVYEITLTPEDKSNLLKALQIENRNAGFYICASEKSEDPKIKTLFKTLSKVEKEHASIFKKLLKEKSSDAYDTCQVDPATNFQKAYSHEEEAIKFYEEAAKNSKNERVKQIFLALVDVEKDHLKLLGNF
jgi:rubrerythrin